MYIFDYIIGMLNDEYAGPVPRIFRTELTAYRQAAHPIIPAPATLPTDAATITTVSSSLCINRTNKIPNTKIPKLATSLTFLMTNMLVLRCQYSAQN